MITLQKGKLPKNICRDYARNLANESAYWYCDTCGQWRTSEIALSGTVICPICGKEPDWKKRPPTFAYGSRYKRVVDLCANGSPWRRQYDAIERCYGKFIDEVNAGLPLHAQERGWRLVKPAKLTRKGGRLDHTCPGTERNPQGSSSCVR